MTLTGGSVSDTFANRRTSPAISGALALALFLRVHRLLSKARPVLLRLTDEPLALLRRQAAPDVPERERCSDGTEAG